MTACSWWDEDLNLGPKKSFLPPSLTGFTGDTSSSIYLVFPIDLTNDRVCPVSSFSFQTNEIACKLVLQNGNLYMLGEIYKIVHLKQILK